MGIPRNGTVGGVGSQANPLVARSAQNAIGFELSDVGICAKVVDALFLRTLRAASLRRWVSESLGGAFWGVDDRFWAGLGRAVARIKTFDELGNGTRTRIRLPCQTMGVPVFQCEPAGIVVSERHALSAVLAGDATCLVLALDVFFLHVRGLGNLWTGFGHVQRVFSLQRLVRAMKG